MTIMWRILFTLWPLWMECNALWSQKCTFWIQKYHEGDLQSILLPCYCLHRRCTHFSESLDQHKKHHRAFLHTVKLNGLVVSAPKIKLFQTKVRFLGFDIYHGVIKPIDRSIQFAEKFPDQILDKTQLQRFLGSLNYIFDFYQNLRQQCKSLSDRLRTNSSPWTPTHTLVVQEIKKYVKTLPCLGIPLINSFKIV